VKLVVSQRVRVIITQPIVKAKLLLSTISSSRTIFHDSTRSEDEFRASETVCVTAQLATFDMRGKMWEFSTSMCIRICLFFLAVTWFFPSVGRAQTTGRERRAVVFYTAETFGTLEPCGCTSDPLGDFARVTALVRKAAGSKSAAMLVDAGSLLFPAGEISPSRKPAARLRADFLARQMGKLPFGGAALGPSDLALGIEGVTPKRAAANLANAPFVEPSRISEVGGIKIGVVGVVDGDTASKAGLSAQDPTEASRAEVARLRAAGAEVVILLAPLQRPLARTLARSVGADFVIVGRNVGKGMARAEPVGRAFLLAPSDELQRVGRLEIVLRGSAPRSPDGAIADAGGPVQTKERMSELDRTIAQLEEDLARWKADDSSDPTFVAGKARERDALREERRLLGNGAWRPPADGSYFVNTLVPMQRSLPRDPALSSDMHKLDRAIGEANLRAAEPPVPAEAGRAFYVGGEACVSCHKSAARSWKKTIHARAWKTLVDAGKEAHDDCVTCHVTGYGEVGGTSLGHTKGFEDVQCEVCHGPGSIHVEKKGKETPFAGRLQTPESICVRCHNEKHSDTFQYQAYLRDVLGPGHGEDARDKLGSGPTGHQLRRKAEARAKAAARRADNR
jgi:hypothetical protein